MESHKDRSPMAERRPGSSLQDMLNQAKLRIKKWESEYISVNSCRPDKAALAMAPDDIKAAYKSYHYYRKGSKSTDSSTREQAKDKSDSYDQKTVCDTPLKDEDVGFNNTCNGGDSSQNFNCSNRLSVDSSDDRKKDVVKTLEKTTAVSSGDVSLSNPQCEVPSPSPINGSVWGSHLNKSNQQTHSKTVSKDTSLYTKMAEKLRASGTIKVRTSLKPSKKLTRGVPKICVQGTTSVEEKSQRDKENISDITSEHKFELYADSITSQEAVPWEENFKKITATGINTLISTIKNSCVSENIEEASSSILDDLGNSSLKADYPGKKSLKFHIRRDDIKSCTQTTRAISLVTSTDLETEALGVKKKAGLNRGWVLRCTGTELGEKSEKEGWSAPSENWKMKVIDKEWNMDEEDGILSLPSSPQETLASSMKGDSNQAQKESHTVSVIGSSVHRKCNPRKIKKNSVSGEQDLEKSCLVHKHNKANNTQGENLSIENSSDAVVEEKCKRRTLRKKGSTVSKVACGIKTDNCNIDDDPYTLNGKMLSHVSKNLTQEEPINELKDSETCIIPPLDETGYNEKNGTCVIQEAQTEENSCAKHVRKRKNETLEELEESGVIQSVWPPPKKKRVARKKLAKAVAVPGKKQGRTLSRIVKKGKKAPETKSTDSTDEIQQSVKNKTHCSKPIVEDYNEIEDIEAHGTKKTNKKSYLSIEERFLKKVSTGASNNNYVRINLKKKTFVRGKRSMNAARYKRQEWKNKQIMKSAESGNKGAIKSLTCFKCGDFGHWAKNCSGKKGDNLLSLETYNENESTFLSLEDAASLALGIKPCSSVLPPPSKMFPGVEESEENPYSLTEENQKVQESSTFNETVKKTDKFEKNCTTNLEESDDLVEMPEEAFNLTDLDDDIFVNINEENMQNTDTSNKNLTQGTEIKNFQHSGPSVQSHSTFTCNKPTVKSLYPLQNGEVGPTPKEVYDALHMFGFSDFRPGQENAVMRVLSGQPTLLVLSTGSGKSLCYQLPAYLYAKHNHCITICVSPLVSLMEDQVTGLPHFLHAVCLHTHQNSTQRSHAMNAIQSGSAQILLVSPEAVVASRTGGVLGTLLKELPPVAFACLDEAHCVSEWSHNFRPSYLRVCQVLRERLGVQTILGLTATARQATALSIARHLLIPNFDSGIIRGTSVPENLHLSVSRDQIREQALISLLQGERFSTCGSIIIYCTRRDECERVATLIRTHLLDPKKVDVKSNLKRTKGISFDAEAYHAGLSSHRRQQVQKKFMSGKLRIVVATVAFGMGIDKADVRGIIHFNMPRNVESYVQEIGRAGRDGEVAHCHLFLDSLDGRDIQELKRHIYANSVDRHTVRKLLNKVFKPCACAKIKKLANFEESENDKKSVSDEKYDVSNVSPSPEFTSCTPISINSQEFRTNEDHENKIPSNTELSSLDNFSVKLSASSCPRHEVAIPIDTVVEELDLPEENLETLLCYIELHQGNLIHLNSHVYANCTVSCYGGPRQLVAVSRRCPPLAVAIALERQKGVRFENTNRVSFPVVEVSSRMGWNSKIVKRELKALEWNTQTLSTGGKVKRSGVTVEFTDLSFHLEARGDLSDDELDQLLDALYRRAQTQEQDQLRQLHFTYELLRSVSHGSILLCCDSVDMDRCAQLRGELRKYFSKDGIDLSKVKVEEKVYLRPEIEGSIRNSVRALISTHVDQQWTGRAVARVFHGIGSPNFPTDVWGRVRRFWRQHLNTDFNLLLSIATQEILKCK
ncbi:uncharacterized protein RecQ4 isoform X2 [Cherax quadricarinatus]|uniref:uncharacterized protein RecQ4 isoform X2 n=1 Tax=Cherax quadricarinatus TaxID=27406 RepID=UPI00387E3BDC